MPARILAARFVGMKFGRLIVVREANRDQRNERQWLCRCDCGNEVVAPAYRLKSGNTNSCGCYRSQRQSETHATHKRTNTPEYESWSGMKKRCFNRRCKSYPDYGGRGITVCDRWSKSFQAFLDDMGLKPDSANSIERVNNNGNYEPGNCKWGTAVEQNRNKRNSRILTMDGTSMTVAAWSDRTGIDMSTILQRKARGWTDSDALTRPLVNRGWESRRRQAATT